MAWERTCVISAYKGKSRHPLYDLVVHLKDLFEAEAASFNRPKIEIYGNKKQVSFLSHTYLLYQPLQFVLSEYEGKQFILVSTDLELSTEDIIKAYAYRFKILKSCSEIKATVWRFLLPFQKPFQNLTVTVKKGLQIRSYR